MDLHTILKKTQNRKGILNKREPLNIAMRDRPYDDDKEAFSQESIFLNEVTNSQELQILNQNDTRKTSHKPNTNQTQTERKPNTNIIQTKRTKDLQPNTNQTQTKHKPDIKLDTELNLNLPRFHFLNGNERKIMISLYENCKFNRSEITEPLTAQNIANTSKIKIGSVKTSIKRLVDKKYIQKVWSKKGGPGAAAQYVIPHQIYQDIVYFVDTYKQDGLETRHKVDTKLDTNMPSSSSYINITTTTLPLEWTKIKTDMLKNFGIAEVRNIYSKCPSHITPEIVQDSIIHFAWGLTNNPDRYKGMRSYVGVLVKELSEGRPWQESEFLSPLEIKKIEENNKIEKLMESIKPYKFNDFFQTLSEHQKENLVPDVIKNSINYSIVKNDYYVEYAKKHFDSNIWPKELENLKAIN